jgi:capsular exopolysaccharide synthesis family protein
MSLSDLLTIVRRRVLVVLAATLVLGGAAYAYSTTRDATYTASSTLRLATVSASAGGGLSPDLEYTDRLANTYRTVVASRPFRTALRERLALATEPSVAAAIPANTELIHLSATAARSSDAARIANEGARLLMARALEFATADAASTKAALQEKMRLAARQLAEVRRVAADPRTSPETRGIARGAVAVREQAYLALQNQYDEATSPTRRPFLTVIEQAVPPRRADFPGPGVIWAGGAILGALLGVALALAAERREGRLRARAAVASTGDTPVLGRVPHMSRATARNGRRNRELVEPFRRIRTTLFALAPPPGESGALTILVTSPGEEEGRTTVACNLATAIARSDRRVLLVDGDLRRPSVHTAFGVANGTGLHEVLRGAATVASAVRSTSLEQLSVLVAGEESSDDADRLAGDRFAEHMPELCEGYDVVVIDGPPLLGPTDSAILAPLVDGVVLVVRGRRTRGDALREARETLELVRARLLGVVVNDADDELSRLAPAPTGAPA